MNSPPTTRPEGVSREAGFAQPLTDKYALQGTHLNAGLGDAALARARVLDDDEGVLAPSRQILLRLPPARLQAQLVQVHQSGSGGGKH